MTDKIQHPWKTYSEQEQKHALYWLELNKDVNGKPRYSEGERQLSVPKTTLCNWWQAEERGDTQLIDREEVEKVRSTRWESAKNDAAERNWRVQSKIAAELEAKLDAGDFDVIANARALKDLGFAIGTFTDKSRELKGESTRHMQVAHKHDYERRVHVYLPASKVLDTSNVSEDAFKKLPDGREIAVVPADQVMKYPDDLQVRQTDRDRVGGRSDEV